MWAIHQLLVFVERQTCGLSFLAHVLSLLRQQGGRGGVENWDGEKGKSTASFWQKIQSRKRASCTQSRRPFSLHQGPAIYVWQVPATKSRRQRFRCTLYRRKKNLTMKGAQAFHTFSKKKDFPFRRPLFNVWVSSFLDSLMHTLERRVQLVWA